MGLSVFQVMYKGSIIISGLPWIAVANLIAPGAGLVMLGRNRSGIAVCLLFTTFALASLWGFLIVPAVITRPVAVAAAVGAGLAWLVAQWLLWERFSAAGIGASRRLDQALNIVSAAIAESRFAEAHEALTSALAQWSEVEEVHVQQARLMTLMGRFPEARIGWERVLEINSASEFRIEAINALERLPKS